MDEWRENTELQDYFNAITEFRADIRVYCNDKEDARIDINTGSVNKISIIQISHDHPIPQFICGSTNKLSIISDNRHMILDFETKLGSSRNIYELEKYVIYMFPGENDMILIYLVEEMYRVL